MTAQPYQLELDTAIEAVEAAQSVINRYFSGDFSVTTKQDNTPVTEVDIKSEQAIRRILTEAFPAYGFYGEETGSQGLEADYLWLVDPIDGTKSFVRHSPYFSTQIALMHQGKLVLGVSNAPQMNELASAVRGQGARLNDRSLQVSDVTNLADVYLSTGNIKSLALNSESWSCLAKLVQCVARTRGYGDFCHYHQLANGQADVVLESDVNILDIAALSVIVEEAGGLMTDLNGADISLDTTHVLACSNRSLHAETLALLGGAPG